MLMLLVSLLLAAPTPERCAAMLLSPSAEMRKAGRDALLEVDAKAVLAVLADRAHSRAAWIRDLEKELPGTEGPRHHEVRELLRILKNSTEDNVGVDFVMLSLSKETARAVLGEGLPSVVFRDGAGWDSWWKTIGAAEGAELLFKTAMPGKDALDVEVEKKRRISYVKDFESDGKIAGPVVGELEAGLTVRWRPVVSRDGRHVTLDIDLLLRDLVRPIAVHEKTVSGIKVRIQVPEQTERRDRTSLTLPLGGCGAYVLPGDSDDVTVVFVRAQLGAPRGVPDLALPEADVGIVRKKG